MEVFICIRGMSFRHEQDSTCKVSPSLESIQPFSAHLEHLQKRIKKRPHIHSLALLCSCLWSGLLISCMHEHTVWHVWIPSPRIQTISQACMCTCVLVVIMHVSITYHCCVSISRAWLCVYLLSIAVYPSPEHCCVSISWALLCVYLPSVCYLPSIAVCLYLPSIAVCLSPEHCCVSISRALLCIHLLSIAVYPSPEHGCVRASKHMRIRILICENQPQYVKNLKNMRNNDFAYWYSDIAFCFNFAFKQLVNSSVAMELMHL